MGWALLAGAQQAPAPAPTEQAPAAASPTVTADYPTNRPGILIQDSDWYSVPSESPSKSHVKHGFAPAVTYGLAPAAMVSDYEGIHARVQIESGLPVICICRFYSIPGDPVIVKLHPDPKKDLRELDAGNLHVGVKMEEAQKNDLVPVNVSQPEDMVWLVQPQQPLPPGEYALMLGTQNIIIYPFTVSPPSPSPPSDKH